VTTQEMLEFGRGIAVSTAQAGGSIKDIIKITEQGVVAAKAFGYGGAYASLEITEMLMGNVSKRMRFVQQLLGLAHTDEHHFKTLDAKHRLALVESVLDSPAMRNATGAFSTSFSGVLSTLEDKVQIALGRTGMPLFEKVTAELSRWSEWLDKNSVKIDHMVDQVGHGLAHGFEVVKDAVSFLVDHADQIIAIGKVWMVTKLAGGLVGGASTSIGGLVSSLSGASSTGAGKASLGGVAAVGTAAYMATTELMNLTGATDALLRMIDPQRAQYEKLKESMGLWDDALEQSRRELQGKGQTGATSTNTYANMMGAASAIDQEINAIRDAARLTAGNRAGDHFGNYAANRHARERLEGAGLDADKYLNMSTSDRAAAIGRLQKERDTTKERADTAGIITQKKIEAVMTGMTAEQKARIDMVKATQRVMEEVVRSLVRNEGGALSQARIRELMLGETADKDPFAQGKPHKTEINIARVEVPAKDPDRWIADLDAAAKRHAYAPRTPRQALKGR